jgi:hypothetical protein
MASDLFNGVGIEVVLPDDQSFLKVKETLTRIGIASNTEKRLYQSCHILHKKDRDLGVSRYSIVHFKELFRLDGKADTFSEEDLMRRNTIAKLLVEWGLVTYANPQGEKDLKMLPINKVKILSFKEKGTWELVSKYSIGKIHK